MRVNRTVAGALCVILGTTAAIAAKNRPRARALPSNAPATPATYEPGVVNLRTHPVVMQFARSPQNLINTIAENKKLFEYRGTRIAPNREVPPNEKATQMVLAGRLSKLDFVPNARVAHFRWMNDHPVKIIGWSGEIESTEETPDGIMVRVRVWADAVPLQGKIMLHADRFYETYLYANGNMKLVSWEDPGPNPGFTRF